jgi:hypothetical protein
MREYFPLDIFSFRQKSGSFLGTVYFVSNVKVFISKSMYFIYANTVSTFFLARITPLKIWTYSYSTCNVTEIYNKNYMLEFKIDLL